MTDEEDVRAIIESWAAAVRAHDIDGVLRDHADPFLMFDVVGGVEAQGLDRYRRAWLDEFFPWHGKNGRFELRDLRVSASDRVAFATSLIDCAGTEEGQLVAFTLRLTVGLEKTSGGWAIVHEHHSEPLPFDQTRIGPASA